MVAVPRKRDLVTIAAVRGVLSRIPPSTVLEAVRLDPRINVQQFCDTYMGGIRLKASGLTRRSYDHVQARIARARGKLRREAARRPPNLETDR